LFTREAGAFAFSDSGLLAKNWQNLLAPPPPANFALQLRLRTQVRPAASDIPRRTHPTRGYQRHCAGNAPIRRRAQRRMRMRRTQGNDSSKPRRPPSTVDSRSGSCYGPEETAGSWCFIRPLPSTSPDRPSFRIPTGPVKFSAHLVDAPRHELCASGTISGGLAGRVS
jgi:hypothetical protein